MVWFVAGVYVAAGAAASLALVAAAFGPWLVAVLGGVTVAIIFLGIDTVTRRGDSLIKQVAREVEEAQREQGMASRGGPHSFWRFITWSIL